MKNRFSIIFQRMLDEPEHQLAALRANPEDFEREVLETEGALHRAESLVPHREALGFLLFDRHGEAASSGLPDWLPNYPNFELMLSLAVVRGSQGRLLQLPGLAGRTIFALWAPYEETEDWNLPASLRLQAAELPGCRVVLFAGGMRPIDLAVSAFGLTELQKKVVIAMVQLGNLRTAAAQLGISYATVRETAAAAAKRMKASNAAALVSAIVAAGFGILPGAVASHVLLADMLGISERQARVALLVSSGAKRQGIALALQCSQAVIKKELEALYANFGIKSSLELSRLVTEAQALSLFARSTDNAPGYIDPAIEPSRFTARAQASGVIAWSDYGPASGKPVLIVHSNWCCRFVPRAFVEKLQKRGWRPIAIDRPGFGGSSLGEASREDPFGQAVQDTLQILDLLKIRRVPLVARCGAQFALALKAAVPERVGGVILISPTPEASSEGQRSGPVGVFKEAFFRSPRLIEFFFRAISAQFTYSRVEHMMQRISAGSATDEALCNDPQFMRDRFRALRPFATGNFMGGVLEELVISQGIWRFEPLAVSNWLILQGGQDPLNSTEEVAGYWQRLLPHTPFEIVPDAGRFMPTSHAALVIDRLDELEQRGQPASMVPA